MGWKAVKDYYRIRRVIQVVDRSIRIGWGTEPTAIVIDEAGLVQSPYRGLDADFVRYQQEMSADLAKLQELVRAPDQFSRNIPVYTYAGARIISKWCEQPGHPHVTHDGELMYENTHFLDRGSAVRAAKEAAARGILLFQKQITEAQKELAEALAQLENTKVWARECAEELAELDRQYPDVVAPAVLG